MQKDLKVITLNSLTEFGYNVDSFEKVKTDPFLSRVAVSLLKNISYDLKELEAKMVTDFISKEFRV